MFRASPASDNIPSLANRVSRDLALPRSIAQKLLIGTVPFASSILSVNLF